MVKQQIEPQRRNEAKPSEREERDELRDEIDKLIEIARDGVLKRNGRADRHSQLRAVVAHWAPALRELEKH